MLGWRRMWAWGGWIPPSSFFLTFSGCGGRSWHIGSEGLECSLREEGLGLGREALMRRWEEDRAGGSSVRGGGKTRARRRLTRAKASSACHDYVTGKNQTNSVF
jgi:hypothetical protein